MQNKLHRTFKAHDCILTETKCEFVDLVGFSV